MHRAASTPCLLALLAACNAPPTAPIVELQPAEPTTLDDLVVQLAQASTDKNDDPVSYAYAWTKDGFPEDTITGDTVVAAETQKGEVWRVVVTPQSGEDEGPSAEAVVTIRNSLPVAEVSVAPAIPLATEDVVATASAEDVDEDEVSFSYRWLVGGEATSYSDATLPADATAHGDRWTVEVTPDDGEEEGEVVSATVDIENTAPVVDSVSIAPDPAYKADTLVAQVELVDVDGDALTTRFSWVVDGTVVQEGESDSLSSDLFDKHAVVSVTVTSSDGYVDSAPVSAEPLTISNSPPTLVSATLSASTVVEGDTLLVLLAGESDDDCDEISFDYAWTADGTVVATTSTLSSDLFAKGQEIQVLVTPSDEEEAGEPVSSDTATVANTPPVLASLAISPSDPLTDDTLTATSSSSDADDDTVDLTYAWFVDGAVASSTSSSLSGSEFQKGQEIYVVATPSDDEEAGSPLSSATVTVGNTAPVISGVVLDPASPVTGETLSCVPSGWTDPDGDAEEYLYTWTVDGVTVGTAATLDASYVVRDAEISCTATPDDGEDTGSPWSSSTVTVGNAPPVISTPVLSNTSPTTNETLSVSFTGTDAEGDGISYLYAWYVDGSVVAATATLKGTSFDKDQEIYVVVTPDDGTDQGDPLTSDTATAVNTPPAITTLTLSPAAAETDDTLTAGVSASDDDGDSISLAYTWYVNGSKVGVTTNTLDGGLYFDKEDEVYVVVIPSDTDETGDSATSSTVTIVNAAPAAPVADILPAAPETSDDLVCVVDTPSTDADGDTVSYTIAWEVDGVAFTGATTTTLTGDTVSSAETADEESWTCTLTPDDGEDSGDAATTTVTIGAIAPWSGAWDLDDASAYEAFLYGEDADDGFGGSLSAADLDGDGLPDLIVGAAGDDYGTTDGGAIYVYSGLLSSGSQVADAHSTAKWYGSASYTFGTEVYGIPDANDDGFDDLVVAQSGVAASYFFYGPLTGVVDGSSSYDSYFSGGCQWPQGVGDFYPASTSEEFICGYQQNISYRGRTRVYSNTTQILELTGVSTGDYSGSSVAGGVDVDGDGQVDILIGASHQDSGGTYAGAIYVVLGPASGTMSLSSADSRILGANAGDLFGSRMATSSDATGDGLADVAVTSPEEDSGGSSAGAVYLFDDLASTSTAADAIATVYGAAAGDELASRLSLGDVDGDGVDDLLVCTENYGSTGGAWLLYGPLSGAFDLGTDEDASFLGAETDDMGGGACVIAGDMDGDGAAEFAIGAGAGDGPSAVDHGTVSLFLGH